MGEKELQAQRIQDAHWSKDKHTRRRPDHPVVRAVFEPLAQIVASNSEDPGRSNVLDVGCGNGFLQWALERRFGRVAGLDYSRQMLEVNPCRERLLGSCLELPFADASFDVVVAANLLHHLCDTDRVRTLAEMKRVARSKVLSFEPNRNNPFVFTFSLIKSEERMALSFSSSYMRGLFEEAGLVGTRVHVQGFIVPNKAPLWWVPLGRTINKTPFRRLGFEICTVGQVRR